jgi:hypothetical protein
VTDKTFTYNENGNLVKSIKESWIKERLDELEQHQNNSDILPFKIIQFSGKGFLSKIKGLYAFISYNHMPWRYHNINNWAAIAPSIKGKEFLCKVNEIIKDENLVILNGKVKQFREPKLVIGNEYKGIITNITNFGFFIDIGHNFNWKHGSVIGLLHKSRLSLNEKLEGYQIGHEIIVYYESINEKEQLLFCKNQVDLDWVFGKPQALIGKSIWAKALIDKKNKAISFLVKGKYHAFLTDDVKSYAVKYRKKIIEAINHIKNNETINCEIIGFNEKERFLEIKWLIHLDTDILRNNLISSNLDEYSIKKLLALKNKS